MSPDLPTAARAGGPFAHKVYEWLDAEIATHARWTAGVDRQRVAELQQLRAELDLLAAVPPARAGAPPTTQARRVVDDQAEDEGLWGEAETAMEAYLQTALRELHAAVERDTGGETGPLSSEATPHA